MLFGSSNLVSFSRSQIITAGEDGEILVLNAANVRAAAAAAATSTGGNQQHHHHVKEDAKIKHHSGSINGIAIKVKRKKGVLMDIFH